MYELMCLLGLEFSVQVPTPPRDEKIPWRKGGIPYRGRKTGMRGRGRNMNMVLSLTGSSGFLMSLLE
jgi:hypothetical protein